MNLTTILSSWHPLSSNPSPQNAEVVNKYVYELFKSAFYFTTLPIVSYYAVKWLFNGQASLLAEPLQILAFFTTQIFCAARLLVHLNTSTGLYRHLNTSSADETLAEESTLITAPEWRHEMHIQFYHVPLVIVQHVAPCLALGHTRLVLDGMSRQFGFNGVVYHEKYDNCIHFPCLTYRIRLPLPQVFSIEFQMMLKTIFFDHIHELTLSKKRWKHVRMRSLGRGYYDMSYYPFSVPWHLIKLFGFHRGLLPQWDPDNFDMNTKKRMYCTEFLYHILQDGLRSVNQTLKAEGCSPLPYPADRYEYMEALSPVRLHELLQAAHFLED